MQTMPLAHANPNHRHGYNYWLALCCSHVLLLLPVCGRGSACRMTALVVTAVLLLPDKA